MGFWDWFTGGDKPDEQTVDDATPPPPAEADIAEALAQVERLVGNAGVPGPVRARVERITRTARVTLPRIDKLGLGSLDAYSVIATATDYLPEAVGGYLRLPRDWADSRPVEGGKTSLLLLVDQLDLLARTMDKMLDAATRTDADALIAHGRFLQAKFGNEALVHQPVHTQSSQRAISHNPLDLE